MTGAIDSNKKSIDASLDALDTFRNETVIGFFVRTLVMKWVVSYAIFLIFYRSSNAWLRVERLGYFDLAGHQLCAMTAYAMWFKLILFINNLSQGRGPHQQELSSNEVRLIRSSNFLDLLNIIGLVGMAFMAYQFCSLFFTCYAYHTNLEVLVGYVCGWTVTTLVHQTDVLSDSFYIVAENVIECVKESAMSILK